MGGAAALGAAACLPAWAQQPWPSRAVRVVVPYPPGGSSDIIGRIIAPRLGEALKQTVVVENKPGANGNLGAAFVVQSGGDGHTVLLCDVGALPMAVTAKFTRSFLDSSTSSDSVLALTLGCTASTCGE